MYLLGASNTAFWYVILIIQLYALYPIIAKMHAASQGYRHGAFYFVSCSLAVQIAYNILIGSNDMCIVNYPLYVIFVSHIFYFILGIAVCEHYETFKASFNSHRTKSVYASILLLGLFFAIVTEAYFFPTSLAWLSSYSTSIASIILPVYSLLVLVICFRSSFTLIQRGTNDVQTKYLSKIGAFSFGIYLTFPFFNSLFGYIVLPRVGIDWNTWSFYPLVFVLTLCFSYLSVAGLYRLPLSGYIIGVQRARKKQHPVH
jgi:hypothetical protein